jgi:hypothetical protein
MKLTQSNIVDHKLYESIFSKDKSQNIIESLDFSEKTFKTRKSYIKKTSEIFESPVEPVFDDKGGVAHYVAL